MSKEIILSNQSTNPAQFIASLQHWNSVSHQAKIRAQFLQTNSETSIKYIREADARHERTQAAFRKAQHALLNAIKILRS